jgi:hypothetical protein
MVFKGGLGLGAPSKGALPIAARRHSPSLEAPLMLVTLGRSARHYHPPARCV